MTTPPQPNNDTDVVELGMPIKIPMLPSGGPVHGDYAKRFWAKVDVRGPDDCWNWTAGLDIGGYGKVGYFYSTEKAHRVAWRMTYGNWTVNHTLHRCNNRLCCNPGHLYDGTDADNNADSIRAGTHRWSQPDQHRGEANPKVMLTEAQVREIRRRYVPNVVTMSMLAAEYGVSLSAIAHIIHRTSWGHLE